MSSDQKLRDLLNSQTKGAIQQARKSDPTQDNTVDECADLEGTFSAQMTGRKIGQYKSGRNKGVVFVRFQFRIVEGEHRGRSPSLMMAVGATTNSQGNTTTAEENLGRVCVVLQKLGFPTAILKQAGQLVDALNELNKRKPLCGLLLQPRYGQDGEQDGVWVNVLDIGNCPPEGSTEIVDTHAGSAGSPLAAEIEDSDSSVVPDDEDDPDIDTDADEDDIDDGSEILNEMDINDLKRFRSVFVPEDVLISVRRDENGIDIDDLRDKLRRAVQNIENFDWDEVAIDGSRVEMDEEEDSDDEIGPDNPPEKGKSYLYREDDSYCTVSTINKTKQTVSLKRHSDDKVFKNVPWNGLSPMPDDEVAF